MSNIALLIFLPIFLFSIGSFMILTILFITDQIAILKKLEKLNTKLWIKVTNIVLPSTFSIICRINRSDRLLRYVEEGKITDKEVKGLILKHHRMVKYIYLSMAPLLILLVLSGVMIALGQ